MRTVLVKRGPIPSWSRAVTPLGAIAVTLLLSAVPILIAGAPLFRSYGALFYGALGTRFNVLETLVKSSPLILTGLAVAFAFRAKFWNIGAEGQLLAGAIVATWIGVTFGSLPRFVMLPLVMVGGFFAGGLWAVIPAVLKTRLNVDDVVSTLLLNFVMIHIMGALLFGVLQKEGAGWPISEEIFDSAKYPFLLARSRFHLGIPLAFLLVFAVWFVNERTVFGYRSLAVGTNLHAARFAGIPTTRVIVMTAVISGGLAGLAGVGEVAAIQFHLLADISPGYGYTGIVIAMLGALHPLGVLLASLFFSVINVGAQTMSRMTGVPSYISGVIEGLSLIVMLVALLLNEYRLKVVAS